SATRFVARRHVLVEVQHWPRVARPQVKKRRSFALAMPQVQAERVIARQASRFVAPQRLRAEVTHWPRAARPRVKKQQPFALAMPQAQAERVIARQASRFVAPRCWPVEVRRWPQAATHSAEQDSMGLAVPARLLPRPGRAC